MAEAGTGATMMVMAAAPKSAELALAVAVIVTRAGFGMVEGAV